MDVMMSTQRDRRYASTWRLGYPDAESLKVTEHVPFHSGREIKIAPA